MEEQLTFGSKDRYYAESGPGLIYKSSPHIFAMEADLANLLRKYNPDVERIVERTVK